MKQIAGAGVVLAVAVAAMRFVGGPQSSAPAPVYKVPIHAEGAKAEQTHPVEDDAYQGGCTVFDPEDPSSTYPKDANRGLAKSVIDRFFALKEYGKSRDRTKDKPISPDQVLGDPKNPVDSVKEPDVADGSSGVLRDKTGVRFVVALAPDPRHTNLSLLFDREMAAIQQAAQDEGYNFNSSWLPWKTESSTYSGVADQQRGEDLTGQRESCPGVLLFRKSIEESPDAKSKEGSSYENALVVLVVGEQPTGGINEDQWSNAIAFLHHNASVIEASPPPLPRESAPPKQIARKFDLLGPTFSGSLASLERDLFRFKSISTQREGKAGGSVEAVFPSRDTTIVALGGSVRGCIPIRWFQKRLQEGFGSQAAFASFEENDALQIYNFLNYLNQQGTAISDVAIVSEDETAYAAPYVPPNKLDKDGDPPSGSCNFPYDVSNRPVRISYPRDISALRSAYEKESVFNGVAARSAHAILDDEVRLADGSRDGSADADTIHSFSGPVSPINQEAILYGIVGQLRAHHSRYVLLRCTNPLDFLFLTRFFHRAYPEGRIVTVGSDLLFRREIDTTEFRGVLALSSYSLLPTNQHWSHLSQYEQSTHPDPHTHRIPESDQEGAYLAARYLFDRRTTLDPIKDFPKPLPGSKEPRLILPFKENLPDFADPFWLHKPGDRLTRIQAPTWLSVVGRDGYWPVAVLNSETTPNQCLDGDSERKKNERYAVASKLCPPRPPAYSTPPSTMVRIDGTQTSRTNLQGAHYDLDRHDPKKFGRSLRFRMPLSWELCAVCVFLLLSYQVFGITQGRGLTSSGLFALFRRISAPSHGILLGVNCALALATLSTLLTVGLAVPGLEGVMGLDVLLALFGVCWPLWQIAFFYLLFRSGTGNRAAAQLSFTLTVVISDIALISSFSTDLEPANTLPLFYRMGHLTEGVSPLVPVLFLLAGFYLWTWQALAGNSMLCFGRPLLPEVRTPALPDDEKPIREYWKARWYYQLLGLSSSSTARRPIHFLPKPCYRISHEIGKRIVKIASPLCVDPKIVLVPGAFFAAALAYMKIYGMPLLSIENRTFTFWMNIGLLIAFLLTVAEAARLFMTWKELQRLLAALSRLRLRRTFAKLHSIESGSLWSVSGNVQRVQYRFFVQQLDAAKRLSKLNGGYLPSIVRACSYGERFVQTSVSRAKKTNTGAVWEKAIHPPSEPPAYIREVFNDAVAEVVNKLIGQWDVETTSLSLDDSVSSKCEDKRNSSEAEDSGPNLELAKELLVRTEEEFVCFHYVAFIQNILARMRTMVLSMTFLFVSVCFSISFYPFVPRTGISMWMIVNLALIAAAVVYVYAGMERDATLSYITSTRPGSLSQEFYLKTAAFLAGPLIGLLTTQFPAISESFLSWLQPGLDALK